MSPTEEEFEEAKRHKKPIVVLQQDVEMVPEQLEFMHRATGGWEQGVLRGRFKDERDVSLAAVRALTAVQQLGDVQALAPVAQQRAAALALGEERSGYAFGGGSRARVVLVPLTDTRLLDDLALVNPQLPDELSSLARSSGLVSQASGIDQDVGHGQIQLSAGNRERREALVTIGEAGEIMVEGLVAGDDQGFGASRIDPAKLTALIERTATFGSAVWRKIDPRNELQHVAAAIGIPDAQMKVYGRPKAASNTLTLGGAMRLPSTVVVPQPALVLRCVDATTDELREPLVAAVKRTFADVGAVEGDA